MPSKHPIKVLVVDDSAFIRKVVRQILNDSPFIEVVGAARNGRDALDKVIELDPDVVTLDLVMPELDGIGFLRAQMTRRPLPVVITSIASKGGAMVIAALEAGALDAVQKPTALASDKIHEIADELVQKVRTAATVSLDRLPDPVADIAPAAALTARPSSGVYDAVVMGLSTGGPQALRGLIAVLPQSFPVPIAVVLHMPVGYTGPFARRLNDLSGLEVREAREGDIMQAGRVLVAQAGKHLYLIRNAQRQVAARLDIRPLDTLHRPAVNVLFQSAAEVYGARTLGVIMTGMGNDGTTGAAWIRAQGGTIIAEDESTCVVYGMPRAAVEAGLVTRVVPLDRMAEVLLDTV